MKKQSYLIIGMLFFIGCSQKPEDSLTYLTGYWQIKSVEMPNGDIKSYPFSNTIDYIGITDSLKGFRKKLEPGFNNTYLTSNNSESVEIKIENDSLNLYYTTSYANWKETVILANETELEIHSMDHTKYHYLRYEPINLNLDE